jgi:hypothetical protein
MVAAQETAVKAMADVLMMFLKPHHDSRQKACDQCESSWSGSPEKVRELGGR